MFNSSNISDSNSQGSHDGTFCIIELKFVNGNVLFSKNILLDTRSGHWVSWIPQFLSVVSFRFIFFFLWPCGPTRALAFSFLRFIDHTQRRITVGRTPLDEWSACRRDLYLTAHNTHTRQTSMPRWGSNSRSQKASGRRSTPLFHLSAWT